MFNTRVLLFTIVQGILLCAMVFIDLPGKAQFPATRQQQVLDHSKFELEAGGYLTNTSSHCRIGSKELGLGLDIDLEQTLGLESTSVTFFGLFKYRFSKNLRHVAKVRYFEILRTASKVLETGITIRNRDFTLGTELRTSFAFRVINADYSYAFLMDDRVTLNATFGFFIMPLTLNFSVGDRTQSANSFVAPLPVIGLDSRFLLSKKFILRQGLHLFYLKLNDLQGKMVEIFLTLEYRPTPRFGLGMGYSSFNVDMQQGQNSRKIFGELVGNIGYSQTGIMLMASFKF